MKFISDKLSYEHTLFCFIFFKTLNDFLLLSESKFTFLFSIHRQ